MNLRITIDVLGVPNGTTEATLDQLIQHAMRCYMQDWGNQPCNPEDDDSDYRLAHLLEQADVTMQVVDAWGVPVPATTCPACERAAAELDALRSELARSQANFKSFAAALRAGKLSGHGIVEAT